MATINRFNINGLIDTSRSVFDNMEEICNNTGAWLTYDYHTGLWSVIINQAGPSTRSFSDSNIRGSIQISGTGLKDIYNAVRVNYYRNDINDNRDTSLIELPYDLRYNNEPDNVLELDLSLTNSQPQAELIARLELRQARVNIMIQFDTDYSNLDINAGDIIDVTNTTFGWDQKKFRVITVAETDTDNGDINLSITALEYDETVYDEIDLSEFTRTLATGIKTVGNIAPISTPSIAVFNDDALPRIEANVQIPDGIVEGLTMWVSDDGGNNYVAVAEQRPTGGGTFTSGEYVNFTYDKLAGIYSAGANLEIAIQAFNSRTSTALTTPVSQAVTPRQVGDALRPDAPIISATGNVVGDTIINYVAAEYDLYANLGPIIGTFANSQINIEPVLIGNTSAYAWSTDLDVFNNDLGNFLYDYPGNIVQVDNLGYGYAFSANLAALDEEVGVKMVLPDSLTRLGMDIGVANLLQTTGSNVQSEVIFLSYNTTLDVLNDFNVINGGAISGFSGNASSSGSYQDVGNLDVGYIPTENFYNITCHSNVYCPSANATSTSAVSLKYTLYEDGTPVSTMYGNVTYCRPYEHINMIDSYISTAGSNLTMNIQIYNNTGGMAYFTTAVQILAINTN